MLALLQTFVLIKESIKLSFFKLVEYLEIQHLWVRLQAQNVQKQIIWWAKEHRHWTEEDWKKELIINPSGHFEPVIEPTNADAPDTQLVQRRPILLLL